MPTQQAAAAARDCTAMKPDSGHTSHFSLSLSLSPQIRSPRGCAATQSDASIWRFRRPTRSSKLAPGPSAAAVDAGAGAAGGAATAADAAPPAPPALPAPGATDVAGVLVGAAPVPSSGSASLSDTARADAVVPLASFAACHQHANAIQSLTKSMGNNNQIACTRWTDVNRKGVTTAPTIGRREVTTKEKVPAASLPAVNDDGASPFAANRPHLRLSQLPSRGERCCCSVGCRLPVA
jgi:hypothetical protein